MEVLPAALPDHVTSLPPIGGSRLYQHWLSEEVALFTTLRDVISHDLTSLHRNLVQGIPALSGDDRATYDAIHDDIPLTRWLFGGVSTGDGLTVSGWLAVLEEARGQILRLHEGGTGIWAGCVGKLHVLLQSLLQERSETDGIPISKVC
eukprot:sb/3473666/